MTKEEFFNRVAPIIVSIANERGYKYPSPIIAQAIVESNWGKSKLSSQYNNYFGLKCGSSWKGASVNMRTKEEYSAGTLTTINDNFRAYPSLEAGINGYFDFISMKRYSNLKSATSPEDYLQKIKDDGYATESNYVSVVVGIINSNNLRRFDNQVAQTSEHIKIAEPTMDIEEVVLRTINGQYGNGEERKQNITLLGYDYTEVQRRVNEKLNQKLSDNPTLSLDIIAKEVIDGKWGNGEERKVRLENAGYNYREVQDYVNHMLRGY